MDTVEGVTEGVNESVENLTDLVQRVISPFVPDFAQGFVDNVVDFMIMVLAGVIIAKLVLLLLNKTLGRMNVELTLQKFIRSIARVVVYFLTILVIASRLGFNTSSIVALASVLSAAFALAAQNSLSNLFGGILLLVTKPFLVGDYVSAGGIDGTVLEIGLLNTLLNTFDNKRVSVPNGTISSATITNYSTEGRRRVDLTVSASYENEIDQVKSAVMDAIAGTPGILTDPIPPFVRVSAYVDSSVTYTVRVWCLNADYWAVYFDLLENIKYSFDRSGVEIPYNHLNVHMKAD